MTFWQSILLLIVLVTLVKIALGWEREKTDEEIKEAMVLDYMTGAYSLLRSSYLDMQYGEKQEYTFTVTQKGRNTWSIGDEELNGFIERILELDKL